MLRDMLIIDLPDNKTNDNNEVYILFSSRSLHAIPELTLLKFSRRPLVLDPV